MPPLVVAHLRNFGEFAGALQPALVGAHGFGFARVQHSAFALPAAGFDPLKERAAAADADKRQRTA